MENNYLLVLLTAALIIGAVIWVVSILVKVFLQMKEENKTAIKAKLLYFDEDAWYCQTDDGKNVGRGFVCLPQEGHFVGEEVYVEISGNEVLEYFVPANSDNEQ